MLTLLHGPLLRALWHGPTSSRCYIVAFGSFSEIHSRKYCAQKYCICNVQSCCEGSTDIIMPYLGKELPSNLM